MAEKEKKNDAVATLAELMKVDIRTVNKNDLVEIHEVQIDTSLPKRERAQDYIKKIKNPYCYLCNGVVVKVSFSGKCRLEDCLKSAMFGEN